MSVMTATETPRVWIGCLASYNAGRLIGEWVDATDVDEMNECRDRVAAAAWKAAVECGDAPVYFGPPEEFFLADHEGFGFNIGEYPNWEAVAQVGALIEEHGAPFRAFLESLDGDPLEDADELADRFAEAFCGEWESARAYAEDYVFDVGWAGVQGQELADAEIASYLDWDLIEQEMFRHGPYTFVQSDDYSRGFVFREF